MERETEGSGVEPGRVSALRDAVDAESVDELVERLDSPDADVRAGAAWGLVDAASSQPTKVRANLDRVMGRTDDEDVWVRRGATWVLAELADEQPDALAPRFSELVDLTRASDPLVRQNGVVAVAGVTKAYPDRATSGLSSIAPLTQSDDPLLRRYAREAVREVTEAIAARAEDADYPMVVRASPEYAGLFPDGVSVVTVDDDDDRSMPVHVSFGEEASEHEREREDVSTQRRPPEEVPAAPSVILGKGDVRPVEKLGSGVLATDYRVDVNEAKLPHGVATLRRLDVSDHGVRDAFNDAVRQWRAVDDHEHVESVLGAGDGWVVSRYDDTPSLDQRGAPETVAEAVWDVACVTRAVSYAHARGVVHGGLHPGAVRFVGTSPEYWDAPAVADWGFAHAASGVDTPPVPAGFAATEHANPETYGRFDQSTDVFGLGAVAYYLLTGEPPVVDGDVVPATRRNPDLPEAVDDLFALVLVDEKAARYDTVLDFQRAFDEVGEDLAGGMT